MGLIRRSLFKGESVLEVICIHSGIWMTLFFVWFIAAGAYPLFRLPEPFEFISVAVSGIVGYLFVAFLLAAIIFIAHIVMNIIKAGRGAKVWLFPATLTLMLVVTVLSLV